MANLLNDMVNFQVGLFAYSRDRIEKMVEKMVDQGKIERKDAQSFAHDMVEAGEQQRKEVQKMVQDAVRENLQAMGITQNNAGGTALTADQVRQIVREELAASKNETAKADTK